MTSHAAQRFEVAGPRRFDVEAAAGENWHEFVRWTLDQGFAGLENLSLIPGTIGAAPIQNIGAYGVEMQDLFHSLQAMNVADGSMQSFDRSDCRFAYRDSIFKRELKDRFVIVSVTFRLSSIAKLHLQSKDRTKVTGWKGDKTTCDVFNPFLYFPDGVALDMAHQKSS